MLERDVTTSVSSEESPSPGPALDAASAGEGTTGDTHSGTGTAAARRGGRWGTGTLAMPSLLRALIAVLSGLAVGFAFQPYNLWPLAFAGIAGLSVVAHGTRARRAFLSGYLFGLAMLGIAINWIRVIVGGGGVAILGVVGLIGFEAVFFALAGIAIALVGRLRFWPVLAAACWTGVEYLYAHYPVGGFGWTRVGYTVVDSPIAGLYPIIGVAGVSFVAALLAMVIGWLAIVSINRASSAGNIPVRAWLPKRVIPPLVVWLIAIGAGIGFAGWRPDSASGIGKTAQVGIVQGNVPGKGVTALGRMRTVTANHLGETVDLVSRSRLSKQAEPDFVLWPENSTDIDPTHDPITKKQVQSAADIAGVPIFVGAAMDGPGPDERQISGLWWDPSRGPIAQYNKRNLVPFGEWIPFRDQLLPLFPILRMTGDQGVPGTKPGALTVPVDVEGQQRQTTVGDMICFELAYDDTVYDTATHGAELMMVQSNNATYIETAQIDQQFAITRARAMELGREIAVSTTNGVSGLIDRDGHVSWRSQERTAASTVASMPLRNHLTPAVRVAPWLDRGLGLLGLAGCVLGIIAARNRSVRSRVSRRLDAQPTGEDAARQPDSSQVWPDRG